MSITAGLPPRDEGCDDDGGGGCCCDGCCWGGRRSDPVWKWGGDRKQQVQTTFNKKSTSRPFSLHQSQTYKQRHKIINHKTKSTWQPPPSLSHDLFAHRATRGSATEAVKRMRRERELQMEACYYCCCCCWLGWGGVEMKEEQSC